MGKLIDSTSSKTAVVFNVNMMIAVMIVSVINVQVLEYGWITYLTLFLWGIQDGIINTHSYQMAGFEFDTITHPFAIYQLIQGVSVFVF